ncbi:MAG TPA: NepR family anti-sigma factor [Sphingomicrobium sp.]|nr:NepR family anti-sigma factor [Sphingomicrobium sp.]
MSRCAVRLVLYDASAPAQGDERLSAKKRSTANEELERGSESLGASSKKPRKSRSSDLGRALRSVYDDTLRESVPDDFLDLLGKLS